MVAIRAVRTATRITALAILALLTPSAVGHASPLDLFGFGGRSPALAGTGVAGAAGYDAVYLNPAGLAAVAGRRVTVGSMGGELMLRRDDRAVTTEPIAALVAGAAFRLPLGGALRDRIGLGFGFHSPLATINRARQPLPGQPFHVLLESRSDVVGVQGGLGIDLG
ncbi:MAG: hypothetical protein AAGC55_26405, partial [Myxococcota bacterium]